MTLTKYFKRIYNLPDLESPLALKVLQTTIIKTNKQVRQVSKKRGECSKHSADDRIEIGKYASEHGVAKTVRHFNNKDVRESTGKSCTIQSLKIGQSMLALKMCVWKLESLPEKTRERPPLLKIQRNRHCNAFSRD